MLIRSGEHPKIEPSTAAAAGQRRANAAGGRVGLEEAVVLRVSTLSGTEYQFV